MSLLPSTNAGSDTVSYFIENIGGSGDGANPVPCIKAGDALGRIRVGNPSTGLIIGSTTAGAAVVRGGGATSAGGSTLALGASEASFQNIVLTDGITTVNGTLSMPGAAGDLVVGDDITLGGDLTFSNGALGASISGYYFASVPVAAVGVIANPAGLTAGVYQIVYVGAGAGNENAQPSGVFVRSATTWFGNAVSTNFTAGAPNAGIAPTAGGATLSLLQGGVGTAPVPGDVFFRKISN